MSSRAGMDFSPLADSDPVPGDPDEVARLAARYARTADQIGRQAKNLRRLANTTGEGWDSDAGRAFASHATDLAGRIGKAEDRYAAAAHALSRWVQPLTDAQAEVAGAVRLAQEAEATMTANMPLHKGRPDPGAPPPTAAQVSAAQAQQAAYDNAYDDMATARRRFEAAVEEYHNNARQLASALRTVSHNDGLHDQPGGIMGWIHRHAKGIRKIAKIATYVATALAVASLVVAALAVPGLGEAVLGFAISDVLEWGAAASIGGALAGHSALALSGDGSWVDVGIDIAALVTFGYGKLLDRTVEAATEGLQSAAAEEAATRAKDAFIASKQTAVQRFRFLTRFPVVRRIGSAGLARIEAGATTAASRAAERILSQPEFTPTPTNKAIEGFTIARAQGTVAWLDEEVPGFGPVEDAAATVARAARIKPFVTSGGMVLDGGSHILEDGFPAQKDYINSHTTAPIMALP